MQAAGTTVFDFLAQVFCRPVDFLGRIETADDMALFA